MSEYGPQGHNGVSVADRTVRHLGIEVANAQISLATQNARLEEIAEVASHVNLDLWEVIQAIPDNETMSQSHTHTILPTPGNFVVPPYQVEAVQRLMALLGR
jgi:tRNA/tmRNA/rRNA uracil-C5-methylase (TrmA/RlmC/RlmD family)